MRSYPLTAGRLLGTFEPAAADDEVRAPMFGQRLGAVAARVRQWEFWPPWLFYLPLVPWIVWLAFRHRGLTTITAANPGIPHGGFVGESKYDIVQRLPPQWVVSSARLPAGGVDERMRLLSAAMERGGWGYPIVLKPDAGERGAGVRLIGGPVDAREYLIRNRYSVLAQAYHPGPFEAGILYCRMPGGERGRIFSLTEKHFPSIVGDGRSTIRALILRHRRYRMQAGVFLARLRERAAEVPPRGRPVCLAVAGNHCQGTMFRDGAHLITPALEARVDEIARSFDGFFFGRFDVRYGDAEALRAGRGFAIVELNGATSESTNIYDPDWPLSRAYRVLGAQWAILFQIGDANRRRGCPVTPLPGLVRAVRDYYRGRMVDSLSD